MFRSVVLILLLIPQICCYNSGTSFGSESVFIARSNADNTLISWGDPNLGGFLPTLLGSLTTVTSIASNPYSFAALLKNGSVVGWGDTAGGGPLLPGRLLKNVTSLYSTSSAFCALKEDGSVVPWGDVQNGGSFDKFINTMNNHEVVQGITAIYSHSTSFIAINATYIHQWGGDQGDLEPGRLPRHLPRISPVKYVASTGSAFAALLNNGFVKAWGNLGDGGNNPTVRKHMFSSLCSSVQDHQLTQSFPYMYFLFFST